MKDREKKLEAELQELREVLRALEQVPSEVRHHHGIVYDSARVLVDEADQLQRLVRTELQPMETKLAEFATNVKDLARACEQLWILSGQKCIDHGELRAFSKKALHLSSEIVYAPLKLQFSLKETMQSVLRTAWELACHSRTMRDSAKIMLKNADALARHTSETKH